MLLFPKSLIWWNKSYSNLTQFLQEIDGKSFGAVVYATAFLVFGGGYFADNFD